MAATVTAPIRESQINSTLFAGESGIRTIQAAVDFARNEGGYWCVTIPVGYPGNEAISSITGGNDHIILSDMRYALTQFYVWNGTQYAPEYFAQLNGFIAHGEPPDVAAASMMGFDPQGTNGVGTGNFRVAANPGKPMPSWQVLLEPQDGSGAPWTILRASAYNLGTGFPRIQMPAALEISPAITRFGDHYNLWIGEIPDAPPATGIPGRGMYVWEKAAENAIDFQGQTASTGAYDQTIRLNNLGGDVTIAPLGITNLGVIHANGDMQLTGQLGMNGDLDLTGTLNVAGGAHIYGGVTVGNIIGPLTIQGDVGITGNLTAEDAAINGDAAIGGVLRLAQDPLQPNEAATRHYVDQAVIDAGGFVFPPAGIALSTGSSWAASIDPATLATFPTAGVPVSTGTSWDVSINPATIAFVNAANTFTEPQTFSTSITTPSLYVVNDTFTTNISNSGSHSRFISIYKDTSQPGMVELMGMDSANGQQTRYFQGIWQGGVPLCFLQGNTQISGNLTTLNYLSVQGTGNYQQVDATKTQVFISSPDAIITLVSASAPTDQKIGGLGISPSGMMHFYFTKDDKTASVDYITAVRSGANCTQLTMTTPAMWVSDNSGQGVIRAGSDSANTTNSTTPMGRLQLGVMGESGNNWPGVFWFNTLYKQRTGADWQNAQMDIRLSSSQGATGPLWSLDGRGNSNLAGTLIASVVQAIGATSSPAPDAYGKVTIGQGGEGSPCLYMTRNNTGTANQRAWSIVCWDNSMRFTCLSDDQSSNNPWLIVQRTGAAPNTAAFFSDLVANRGLTITGTPVSPYLANTVRVFNNGTNTYFDLTGPDTATRPGFRIRAMFSDSSSLMEVFKSDNQGNVNLPQLVTSGNQGFQVGGAAGPRFWWDGGSTFLDAMPGGRLLINQQPGSGSLCQITGALTVSTTANISGNFQVGVGGDFSVTVGSKISCWQRLECNAGLNVTQGGKNFRIVHPLDEEKYLYHSCIEGPEIAVFYRGEVVLADGRATITLPDYFEALTFPDGRTVLLTQVDDDKELAVMAASRIIGGTFHIRASVKDATVAWEVKAVRRLGADPLEVVTPRDRASEARVPVDNPDEEKTV